MTLRRHRDQSKVISLRGRTMARNVAVAFSAVLILSGCNPVEETPPPRTSTAAPTTEQASTPAPPPATEAAIYRPATEQGPAVNVPVPVLPELAKEFSKEGLIAFTEYWYSTLGYAFETGDPEPMMVISGPDCETCINISVPVRNWYQNGGWIVGGLMEVHSTEATFEIDAMGNYQVTAMVQQSPGTYYSGDGTVHKAYPPSPARADIVLAVYTEGLWLARTAEHLSAN